MHDQVLSTAVTVKISELDLGAGATKAPPGNNALVEPAHLCRVDANRAALVVEGVHLTINIDREIFGSAVTV